MKASGRQLHIDSLRVIAAQLIVLHHLTVYGPLSVALNEHLPNISYWLFHEARLAVQIFLVVGGYVAAMSLGAGSATWKKPLWVLWLRRYWRLIRVKYDGVIQGWHSFETQRARRTCEVLRGTQRQSKTLKAIPYS
jgi:surface polysaccharide O-acyltransferase-like enzyme